MTARSGERLSEMLHASSKKTFVCLSLSPNTVGKEETDDGVMVEPCYSDSGSRIICT